MSIQTRLVTFTGTALAVALTGAGVVTPPALASTATIALRPAVAPKIPAPPKKSLPVAVDAQTPYVAQVSCDPRTRPGVAAFAALMRAHYKTGSAGTNRTCARNTSEHYDGRALDWMVAVNNPRQKAIANSVVRWLSAGGGTMARRFGISYIIFNRKTWAEYAPERGWTAYTGSSPHTDHIHFSFSWDGAMKRTSWWTGKATKVADRGPCRVYRGQFAPLHRGGVRATRCTKQLLPAPYSRHPVFVFGKRSSLIAVAQRRLHVSANGQFGMATFRALVAYQTRVHIPVTGVLDKATWVKLIPSSRNPASTTAAKPGSLVAYRGLTLKQGSRGAAVVALQRALRVSADGDFGPKTCAAVKAVQRRAGLAQTGVVRGATWVAIEKQMVR